MKTNLILITISIINISNHKSICKEITVSIVLVATCNISELPVNFYISNSIVRVVTCNIHHLYITCQTCKIHSPVSPAK